MKDTLKVPNIRGEITILKGNEIIFKDHNEITGDALEILIRGLANVPINYSVDVIRMQGDDFVFVNKTISNTIIDPVEPSITFITQALEEDFNGTIHTLTLLMSSIDKKLANRTGLSIVKNSITRLEVRWKISLSLCS